VFCARRAELHYSGTLCKYAVEPARRRCILTEYRRDDIIEACRIRCTTVLQQLIIAARVSCLSHPIASSRATWSSLPSRGSDRSLLRLFFLLSVIAMGDVLTRWACIRRAKTGSVQRRENAHCAKGASDGNERKGARRDQSTTK